MHEDFSRLYDAQARSLLVFFQRRVQDPELAVDLMAETFTLALERRHQYQGTTDPQLSGWLWAIAQSVLRLHERRAATERQYARSQARQRRALTDEELERIDELGGNEHLRRTIAGLMTLLPPDTREAIHMRFVEERDFEEIAAELGLTTAAARTRVARGLRHIARELRERRTGERWPS